MTTRRRRPGKEHVGEEENSGDGPDERLPERLFATDGYQSRRLNVYSSLEFLVAVKDVLRGTPEMDRILARQLVMKKRYVAWPVFGGNPLRFSMVEFGRVTGLPCGEFEEGYVVDMKLKYKEEDYAYWDKLFDGRRDITIPDVVQMLVTYECIPQLLARLSGKDDQKIIDCQSLPQHTGLNLVDVLEAEHHPELTVKPMMEIGPDGWGEWDDEIDDRRVKYMVRLIEDGHKFKKSM
ncbi:hypothetical protein HID58_061117 [Brassica napus]|uniref:DUF1985 domain-containing protein n=1 Tax=Brassica napus TaxID=3708 RepID=A0ABQ7ZYJ8_BRANA|nr:hypothetical protein HID58_061117 [Brassica napus]